MSNYFKRLAEQVVVVFGAGFLSAFVLTDLSSARGAAFAGGAAVLKLLYGLAVKFVGDSTEPRLSK